VCTLSWTPLPGGYALAMNRDERRTRAPGTPPAARTLRGTRILCPADGEAGGTWIAVNQHGLSVALLNRYDDTPHDPAAGSVSRGLLVLELASASQLAALEAALRGQPLRHYRPFTLACASPAAAPRLFEWDGQALLGCDSGGPGLLRASSGADQEGAERERGNLFRAAANRPGGLTPALLEALHRSHLPVRGALSVCMHRDDAVTVSSSLVTVTAAAVTLRQWEGSPCESKTRSELTLARAREPGP